MDNRQLYFDRKIRNTKTPEEYLAALAASPYKTHRRMAIKLQSEYKVLKEQYENKNPKED